MPTPPRHRIRRRTLGPLIAWAAALALTCAGFGPAAAEGGRVTVFAAASMKDALDEIAAGFEAETGEKAVVSLAGSAALARQIAQGAPADVFISASQDWMDALAAQGLIDSGSRFDLAANALVLIAHGADAPPREIGPGLDLAGLLGEGRLAMALVEAVPAGIYGKAALETLGLWSSVAPKVAQADNVRAALALVALGEAPFGVVYATDGAAEARVSVVGRFPPESHPPIVYPAASIAASANPLKARFLGYLRGVAAREALARQGFVIIGE